MDEKLKSAIKGDINAYNELFKEHENFLKTYLYRLLTNREDVEDFYHNTFIHGFDNIRTFKGNKVQFKSWIFTIATRRVFNHLKKQKKWHADNQDICRDSLVNDPIEQKVFFSKVAQSELTSYEIKEHIDFCFTCINKTLTIEKQVSLLLKNVYDFKVREVAQIMGKTLGQVKHSLVAARKEMTEIYNGRCALINQKGTCHQCSELQGIFNPKSDIEREANKIKMVKDSDNLTKKELFKLRNEIVKNMNPTNNNGSDLHELLMQHLKKVNHLK